MHGFGFITAEHLHVQEVLRSREDVQQ